MTLLERAIQIYKMMENPTWEGVYLYGSVRVNEVVSAFLHDFEDDLDIELEDSQGTLINSDNLSHFENIQIKFLPPRKEFSFFARDFDDYLTNFGFLYNKADEFYISNIDGFYNDSGSSNKNIDAYCKIIGLYELLLRVSDHTEMDAVNAHKHIILSVSGKDEIPVDYNSEDISQLSHAIEDIQVKGIEDDLFSKPHKSAKVSLFKKAISQYLSGNKDAKKFSILIESLPDIFKSYKNNYELFLHEFSFEDEKEKLEKNKQEYLLKLNEILGGIHGKLLAVPVSLVVVAGQMKPPTEDNYFLINLIILAGAFVFALLMWMLTANQLHSLLAVKTDYSSKKERLKLELRSSLYDELSQAFEQLDARFKHQRRMIWFVDGLVLLGLLFSAFVFEFHTAFIESLL